MADILHRGLLSAVFQPIVELASGRILGHESLIRGPLDTTWHSPDALFQAAAHEGLTFELEIACVEAILAATAERRVEGRVFVNLSAQALVFHAQRSGALALVELGERLGVTASKLVIEVTEHERVREVAELSRIVNPLRARGVAFALDDFGDGRSSLRLWAELEPDFVKIDKYFTREIADHPAKTQTLHALRQIADTFGSRLVAEGLEDGRSLAVVRDLGVEFGQGYFLARPSATPAVQLDAAADVAIRAREVAVFSRAGASTLRGLSLERMLIEVVPVAPCDLCDDVLCRLHGDAGIASLPVVEGGRPVGLINRRAFIEHFSQPFRRELFGRRPCSAFMDPAPRTIERTADGDQILAVLTSEDQRYLSDGFIITDGGRYAGIGSGQHLVRTVSEHRLEAARHANPLTLLPGNIPINDHIERLLRSRKAFAVAYLDLRHFKPFNDVYGYWRGDEMIRLLASVVQEQVDPRRDFVGHVGGDDFVVLFQSTDGRAGCAAMIAALNVRAKELYDDLAIRQGGITAEDRIGRPAFFPLLTLSVGLVWIESGRFRRPEEVASAAAAAKRVAKHTASGLYVQGDPLEPDYEFSMGPQAELPRRA
ncbi:MAG: EAL domain-containing protein [Pseudomonadota bacterium]|nr:EAL domain-containing protein [Pseudomonadota bacterium]